MEEKEIIKEVLNEIVEKVVNSNPERVTQIPLRGMRRGIPPRRHPKKYVYMDSELYLNEKDEQDEIIINVSDKYKNYKITRLGDAMLMRFLSNIHKIREEKLSLRGITLSRIPILEICDPNTENARLPEHMMGLPNVLRPKQSEERYSVIYTFYLNLGLNPYIYFNDYYIDNINSIDLKNPIIVLKRYLKYNPNIRDNLITINYPTTLSLKVGNFTCKGKEILKKRFYIGYTDNWGEYDEAVPIVANGKMGYKHETGNGYLLGFMLEELKDDDLNFMFDYYIYNHDIKLSNEFEVSSDTEDDDNLTIWKYGREILKEEKYMRGLGSNVVAGDKFEWLKKKRTREYDLVKNYEKITDFEKMVELEDNEDEDEYYKIFENIGYYDIKDKLIDKMKMLAGTSICNENDYIDEEIISKLDGNKKLIRKKRSRLTEILLNYIADVQEYIFEGDDKRIRRYIKREDLFNIIYDNEKIYEELLNENIFKIMEKGLERYEEEIINNEQFELQTPDIYILLGFHEFPSKFSREFWDYYEFSKTYKWRWIIKSQAFLESTGWYYMYGLCCFFAQLIGPSYYLYNYYLINKNEYCPNNSLTLNKFFAVAYYLVLYARMNSFWNSLTTTTWQYGNTTLISNDNFLRLTLIVNSICLCIIPLFTYTLFIEMSSITDLILNCLTGEFLINIDNLIVEFIGEENYIKSITKDLLILSFIEKGFPKKNIMEGDTIELWLISALRVIQMFGTLMMTCIVYKCI